MLTPSSIASSTTHTGSISPATACDALVPTKHPRIDQPATECQKLSASEAPDPGRHHVGILGDIIPESPGGFVGIRSARFAFIFDRTLCRRSSHKFSNILRCDRKVYSLGVLCSKRINSHKHSAIFKEWSTRITWVDRGQARLRIGATRSREDQRMASCPPTANDSRLTSNATAPRSSARFLSFSK